MMRRFGVVPELTLAVLGTLALISMGGGWLSAIALLCVAAGIGVVLSRRP